MGRPTPPTMGRPTPLTPKATSQVLELTLVYRVEVQYLNVQDVLDKLRENGSAEVTKIALAERPV